MATTITMPQLGETVTEGTVAQWLKKPGDTIEKYEAFVEISTDKVNAEVPSPVSGVLREIIVAEGQTVPIGAALAVIDEVGAATEDAPAQIPGPAAAAPAPVPAQPAAPVARNGAAARNGNSVARPANSTEALQRVSPAVRRLAREHNVVLSELRGSGQNGRITADDVLAAASAGRPGALTTTLAEPPVTATPAAPNPPATSSDRSTYAAPRPGTLVPLTQARKIIAKRMVESLETAPHAWTMVEVDVTNAWAWRARERERFLGDKGYPLTLLPFFIYAVVRALKAQPLLNARFTEEGIYVERDYNIGIAIGLDSNLMVPVIRAADTLSIAGLAIAAGKLVERARSGKLGADELGGGTFTVNNTGANGSILSKPIINGGQAGIVTMEAVVKRPVVIADAIAIRSMMNVCLSLDHRVIDGTIANAFLAEVKTTLETMVPSGSL